MGDELFRLPLKVVRATLLGALVVLFASCASMLSGGNADPPEDGVNQAPMIVGNTIAANITAPETGQTVKFSMTVVDPENKPTTCTWDDGNNNAGEFDGDGSSVFWYSDTPGTFTIKAVVYDDKMLSATASTTITVTQAVLPPPDNNTPPVFSDAGIKGDVAAPVAGQKIIFSVQASDNDGDPIEYIWSDSTGQNNFSDETVGTDGKAKATWKISSPGTYTITATANDGHVSSKLSSSVTTQDATVTVGAFPATFKYMGAAYCGSCHSTIKTEWEGTAHSTKEDRMQAAGMGRMESCRQCHNTGYSDGGYIDYDLTKQYANVQCESCHGSGVGHPANGKLPQHFAEEDQSCGKCHIDGHHPTYEEYQESDHFKMEFAKEEGMWTNKGCVQCHNGEWFVKMQINGEAAPTDNLPEGNETHIGCATCHDPHNGQFDGQLRVDSKTDVILPFDDTPVNGDTANTCLKCHNGRRTRANMDTTIAKGGRGMHGNAQGTMLFGVAGFQFPDTVYDTEHPHNTWNAKACVTCHMYKKGFDSEENPAQTGHSWEPKNEACLTCHTTQTPESMEAFKEAYVEEIKTLMAQFVDAWPAAWKDVSDPANPVLWNKTDPAATPPTVGPPSEDPIGNEYREAWWNYSYVKSDGSFGVHNPTYAKQLLETALAKVNELNALP